MGSDLAKAVRMRYAEWMSSLKSGYHWVVDADLKSYFDSIPQEGLMERIRAKIADGRVLKLVEQMLEAGVMDSVKGWQPTEQGTPQGAVVTARTQKITSNLGG